MLGRNWQFLGVIEGSRIRGEVKVADFSEYRKEVLKLVKGMPSLEERGQLLISGSKVKMRQ